MTDRRDGVFVLNIASLDGFQSAVEMTQGVFIKDVPANTVLEIRTQNTTYSLMVVDPAEKRIKFQGGEYFPELTDCILQGSTFGGRLLKIGWIGVEMCLEVHVPGRELPRVTTSPVRQISIVTSGSSRVY